MQVKDLFNVHYGHSLELNRLTQTSDSHGIAFVSRTARNNGVSARVEPIEGLEPAPAGAISVSLGGRNYALETSLQVNPFYCGRDVSYLLAKRPMDVKEKLWWATCIKANRYRFNFGRQANKTLSELVLPDEVPEWVSSATLPAFRAQSAPKDVKDGELHSREWRPFLLSDLFDLTRGRRLLRRELEEGSTPYVRATAERNGVSQRVDVAPDFSAGLITVASNGSVGEAFYQPEPFVASDDVVVLTPKEPLSEAASLFVCVIIRREKYRFNYGRKWFTSRMNESLIRLPVNSEGYPDWEFMTAFVASLPAASLTIAGSQQEPGTPERARLPEQGRRSGFGQELLWRE